MQLKVQQHGIIVKHCYREANIVVDALAKYATTLSNDKVFTQEANLPKEARGSLRMDKLQLPSFIIRVTKYSIWNVDLP